jgi:predicted transcriptional regulator YheO
MHTARRGGFSVRERWKVLADCIADLLGPRAEVVLHDVRHPDRSIVYIRNGHVTGREVGAPLTDLGFLMLRDAKRGKDESGVYHSRTSAGKDLECNALVLRDDQNAVAAILCINLDITGTSASTLDGHEPPEHYYTNASQVIDSVISEAGRSASLPAIELASSEKMQVIGSLYRKGVFLARGAVRQVSSQLGMAPSTVYKYIQNTRSSTPKVRTRNEK